MKKEITQTYPKPPSPCNCMNIHRASRAVVKFYDEILKPSGLTISQTGMVKQIELLAPVNISELAREMRIDRTTLNRNLKPLTAAGLITVETGSDSRAKQVNLTPPGKKAAAESWQLWCEAQGMLKGYLGEDDLEKFVDLMAKLEALVP